MAILREVHPSRLKIGAVLYTNLGKKGTVELWREFGGCWEWTVQFEDGKIQEFFYDCQVYGDSNRADCMKVELPRLYRQNPIKKVKSWKKK